MIPSGVAMIAGALIFIAGALLSIAPPFEVGPMPLLGPLALIYGGSVHFVGLVGLIRASLTEDHGGLT